MNRKNILLYLLALVACFLLGLCLAFGLRALDARQITPLSGGQTLDFADFGFTLRVPEDAIVRDHTQEALDSGEDVLYAGSFTTEAHGALYLYCKENAERDSLTDYSEREVVRYYMRAGATQVRTRDFGGRRFICYRASVVGPAGEELWDTYETWDERVQITFETRMNPGDVLPILATIDFGGAAAN